MPPERGRRGYPAKRGGSHEPHRLADPGYGDAGTTEEGRAYRDAHRKAHGCVKATFEVLPGLNPDARRRGLRQTRHVSRDDSFLEWLGQEPGRSRRRRPRDGDQARQGPGREILDDEKDAATQDFLLINSPVFFIRNAADYVALAGSDQLRRGLEILPESIPSVSRNADREGHSGQEAHEPAELPLLEHDSLQARLNPDEILGPSLFR